MPPGLKEHYITVTTAQKPLILFHLIRSRMLKRVLVFTKSAKSTERLVKLLEELESEYCRLKPEAEWYSKSKRKEAVMRAFSSHLSSGERKGTLVDFGRQCFDMYVLIYLHWVKLSSERILSDS